ncbi:MAG TPA: hypothetical protein VGO22_14860 [Pseudorhizobium sp.]|nr:hypothetical protein [Pseudorhizobium sp.]
MTRALSSSAVELDNEALVAAFATRMDAATKSMLQSAPTADDIRYRPCQPDASIGHSKTVRNVFERSLSVAEQKAVREQLIRICTPYLDLSGG